MKNKINEKDVREVLNNMGDIFVAKNKRYGNSVETSIDKYGLIAVLTRISDKFNRFEYLVMNEDNGTADESIIDTLIDMANYSVMTAVYIMNRELKNKK